MEPIIDEILYLVRDYYQTYQGSPNLLLLSADNLARLREELELDYMEDLSRYHGMEIQVVHDGGNDFMEVDYEI